MRATREFALLGQKIVVKEGSESQLASIAVELVDSKVAQIKETNPLLGPNQIAVLALVEIAGELVRDRKLIDQYREELSRKCVELKEEITRISSLKEQFQRDLV